VSIDEYLNSINQLKDALQTLESLKYKSSEKIAQDLRASLAKGIQELDQLFSAKLLEACNRLPANCFESHEDHSRLGTDQMRVLTTLSDFLSDSLVQLGPLSNFIKAYQEIRSTYLTKGLTATNVAAKDQEIKMGYQRTAYQPGSSLLIPYAKQLINALKVSVDNLSLNMSCISS
jgi:hypothetical protein